MEQQIIIFARIIKIECIRLSNAIDEEERQHLINRIKQLTEQIIKECCESK